MGITCGTAHLSEREKNRPCGEDNGQRRGWREAGEGMQETTPKSDLTDSGVEQLER